MTGSSSSSGSASAAMILAQIMASASAGGNNVSNNNNNNPTNNTNTNIISTATTANNLSFTNDSQRRIQQLHSNLAKFRVTTLDAKHCCLSLSQRANQLDSLTSPASDTSTMLSQAASHLGTTLVKLKDARDKFETVRDCEPAMDRLRDGVREMENVRLGRNNSNHNKTPAGGRRSKHLSLNAQQGLSEQDVYAAADSMEICKDAFEFFLSRKNWRSTPSALQQIERLHKQGVNSMCTLITSHLLSAGPAIALKRAAKGKDGPRIPTKNETAQETRERLTRALQNRDLLKSIGEYEEAQPIEARPIREMRAVFECLGGEGHHLGPPRKKEPSSLTAVFGLPANKVLRTEKVGSGGYSNLVKKPIRTGFAQLDAYAEARKEVAFKAIDGYYRKVKAERKKKTKSLDADGDGTHGLDADAAARDAVKCLEHAMVVVAGEKTVYRAIVAPSLVQARDEDAVHISPFYRKACVAAYSHVVAAVVDRTMDIIETVFLKEGGIGQSSGTAEKEGKEQGSSPTSNPNSTGLTVREAASAAAAGLRMLDGVRMLGPSLAKLCDMPVEDPDEKDPVKAAAPSGTTMSIASTLCIAIHRTTVKDCAKTLENLAKSIQEDPNNGMKHRPPDARLASVTSDVVRAIRIISPFVSAYKSVTKRRALPWDPNIGEEAGEMDSYVRFLVMRLLNSLQGKALNYTKNAEDEGGQAKSNMFMINNTFYLLQQLLPNDDDGGSTSSQRSGGGAPLVMDDAEMYSLDGTWFKDKVSNIFESERGKYLAHWENINSHLTSVDSTGLEYQKNKNILSLESGRLFKDRFKGFNDEFHRMWEIHHALSVIDNGLRKQLQQQVKEVFMSRYEKFYEKYSRFRFSKKNQSDYLKYPPKKVNSMLDRMYGGNLTATASESSTAGNF